MDIFYSVFGFIVGIGLLIIIHELGHFYAARLCNVRVLRFSIGFGPYKTIWYDRFGTEYVISAIPLGGYIQLLDTTNGDDNNLSIIDQNMALDKQSPWVRMFIFLAGPLVSILFAVILYWAVFIIGIKVAIPIVGSVSKGSTADLAKLRSGLEITKINDHTVYDWEDIISNLINNISVKNKFIKLQSYDIKSEEYYVHVLHLSGLSIKNNKGNILKTIGIEPFKAIEIYVNEVLPKYPAFLAGIKVGDIIVAIDHIAIKDGTEIAKYLQDKVGKITITIKRDKELLNFILTPTEGLIGIKYYKKQRTDELFKIHKYGVIDSFYRAVIKTYNYTLLSFRVLFETILRHISLKNMAGPVAIGYYAGQAIKNGVEHFLNFLGLISISLGVLNLLPIPWLDGGSIVYCIYEILTGKQASLNLIRWGRTIGLIFLIFLMILVFVNDISRF